MEERLEIAQNAFKSTLIAWSRLEDEAKGDAEKMRQLRGDWGRMMKKFLTPIEYPDASSAQSPSQVPSDALVHEVPENH